MKDLKRLPEINALKNLSYEEINKVLNGLKSEVFRLEKIITVLNKLKDDNSRLEKIIKQDNINEGDRVHYDALKDCCNDLLDSVDKGKQPMKSIMGLKILLNR